MPKFIDYAGRKIGRVNVLELIEIRSGGTYWKCKCDCGKNFTCWSANFRNRGDKFECKECVFERKRGIDLIGRKFGRWTVLKRQFDNFNKTQWHCKCDCGNEGLVSSYCLGRQGKSQSCGCLGRKMKSKHINTTLYPPKHLLSGSRFYAMKTALIHKCYNEKNVSYPKFGGIGITVCDLWRNGAKDMYEWAIENGWQEGDVICLKDGCKEFNPGNCYMISESQFRTDIGLKNGFQVTYKGETHSISMWSKILDVNPEMLRKKLTRFQSVEKAFESKFTKHMFLRDPSLLENIIDLYNSGKTQTEIYKITGIQQDVLRYQLIKSGVNLRKEDIKQNRNKNVSDDDIKNLLENGMNMNQIAKKLGCSWQLIYFRVQKYNNLIRDRTNG